MIDLALLKVGIGFVFSLIGVRLIAPSRCKTALCALAVTYFFLDYYSAVNTVPDGIAGLTIFLIGFIMGEAFQYLSKFPFPDTAHCDKIAVQEERTCLHMEELLKQILAEVKDLKSGQQRLEHSHEALRNDVTSLKNNQGQIIQRIDNFEGQQRENTDIIKAVLHNQEEFSAQLEALTLNTASKTVMENVATKEDISKLDAKFEVLNSRLFNQETEVARLKAVK